MTSAHLRLMEGYLQTEHIEQEKDKQEKLESEIGKIYNRLKIIKLAKGSSIQSFTKYTVECLDCDTKFVASFDHIAILKYGCECNKSRGILANKLTHEGKTKTLKQWAYKLGLTTQEKIRVSQRYGITKGRTFQELFYPKDRRVKNHTPCITCGVTQSSRWYDSGKLCLTCHTLNKKTLATKKRNEAINKIKDIEEIAISKIRTREALAIDKVKAKTLKALNKIGV